MDSLLPYKRELITNSTPIIKHEYDVIDTGILEEFFSIMDTNAKIIPTIISEK
jgi:hypothetical protein